MTADHETNHGPISIHDVDRIDDLLADPSAEFRCLGRFLRCPVMKSIEDFVRDEKTRDTHSQVLANIILWAAVGAIGSLIEQFAAPEYRDEIAARTADEFRNYLVEHLAAAARGELGAYDGDSPCP